MVYFATRRRIEKARICRETLPVIADRGAARKPELASVVHHIVYRTERFFPSQIAFNREALHRDMDALFEADGRSIFFSFRFRHLRSN